MSWYNRLTVVLGFWILGAKIPVDKILVSYANSKDSFKGH